MLRIELICGIVNADNCIGNNVFKLVIDPITSCPANIADILAVVIVAVVIDGFWIVEYKNTWLSVLFGASNTICPVVNIHICVVINLSFDDIDDAIELKLL